MPLPTDSLTNLILKATLTRRVAEGSRGTTDITIRAVFEDTTDLALGQAESIAQLLMGGAGREFLQSLAQLRRGSLHLNSGHWYPR